MAVTKNNKNKEKTIQCVEVIINGVAKNIPLSRIKLFKKIGGGPLVLFSPVHRNIMPGDYFFAFDSEISKAFRDSILEVDQKSIDFKFTNPGYEIFEMFAGSDQIEPEVIVDVVDDVSELKNESLNTEDTLPEEADSEMEEASTLGEAYLILEVEEGYNVVTADNNQIQNSEPLTYAAAEALKEELLAVE